MLGAGHTRTTPHRAHPAPAPYPWAVNEMPRDYRPAKSIRVLLAEDQGMMRGALALLLGMEADIEVVAQVGAGDKIVDAALIHRPDVALLDIELPGKSGLDAAAELRDEAPDCRVLILTTFDLDRYVYAALAAGASGFLLKDVTPEHLANAVRLVNTGDALLAPSITRRLVERFAVSEHVQSQPAIHRDLAVLTPRELEVLTLMGHGLSNAELATELTLSEATVKTHVARIFAKLSLRDRAQAVVLAYETGLVTPERS